MHLYFTNLLDNKILMIMCVPCKFINQLSHVEVRVVAAKLQITIGCCHKRRKFTLNYRLAWKRKEINCWAKHFWTLKISKIHDEISRSGGGPGSVLLNFAPITNSTTHKNAEIQQILNSLFLLHSSLYTVDQKREWE